MKVAVLSGKGGAGKTFVAVNLAAAAGKSTYIDCDVEEPNGRLFLKPQDVETQVVSTKIPAFDPDKCTGCRKCVDFCRFNALIYIKENVYCPALTISSPLFSSIARFSFSLTSAWVFPSTFL